MENKKKLIEVIPVSEGWLNKYIFSYELESGLKNLEAASCKNVSLCNYQTLVEVAAEVGEISEDSIAKLSAWRQNPADESWLTK